MSHQPCSRFHRDTLPVDATWFRLRDAVCRNLLICGASQERRNELGVSRRPARVGKAKGFARKVPTSHPLRWDQIMAFLDQYFGPRIAYLDFLVHTDRASGARDGEAWCAECRRRQMVGSVHLRNRQAVEEMHPRVTDKI
ncbi:hypothetical protein DFH06DRAFT_1132136 [Mycena polygramma]|nr:hypothetical protein DFH06DRAFT_1132136 [Mycena polygramma]